MIDHAPMNEESFAAVAKRFRILGVPLRLEILHELAGGERTVSELVEATGSTQPNVSKHLSTLLTHRFVQREQRGNSAYYSIADASIFKLCDLVCGSIQRDLDVQRLAFAGGTKTS